MSVYSMLIILSVLFITEILYFKTADHFNIIDRPNHRSSHQTSTIRGGGVIFAIGALLFFFSSGFQYPYFIVGLCLISLISFLDDLFTLNNKVRFIVHILSVVLMLYQLELFGLPWYWLALSLIFVIGTINAYNFMDGINGITGGYSLVAVGTLYYINTYILSFSSNELLIYIILSLLVFNFFNFRYKAKCFAGDVGSISIAFIVLFFIFQLIVRTGNFNYLLFLTVYGLDAVTTIAFRLIRKENIFEAHRSHFYQFLANERKVSHVLVSFTYALIQLLINIIVVFWLPGSFFILLLALLSLTIIFIIIRFSLEGTAKLLKS